MNDKILFIDTETGGLDPIKYSLLSVGLVVWCDFKFIDQCEIFINDGELKIHPEALKINKIDIQTHQSIAIAPDKALFKIKEFISKNFPENEKVTLAGHNVNFDISFLRHFFETNFEKFGSYFSHRSVDTSSILYYLYLAGKLKEKSISSEDAFRKFRIKVEKRHSALGDALATAELFNKLITLIKKRLHLTKVDELQASLFNFEKENF